jgi:hypothetical protein
MTDPLLQLLDALPSASLDSKRDDRIRARCHTALARRRRRRPRDPRKARFWTPIVACVGGVYLTAVLHQAIAIFRIL